MTAADLRAFIEEVVASAPIESQVNGYNQHTGDETFDGVICTGCVNSAATEDEIQHDPKCLRMRGVALLAESIADADKIGVFTYRSTMGTYTMIVRDNAHECSRGANLFMAGQSVRSRHVDWDAMPEGARDYFATCMSAGEQL